MWIRLSRGSLEWKSSDGSPSTILDLQLINSWVLAGVRKAPRGDTTVSNLIGFSRKITSSICIFVHDQFKGHGPKVFDLSMVNQRQGERLSRSKIIRLERRKTGIGRNGFLERAARVWNNLPHEMRNTDSRTLFKKRLRKLLSTTQNARLNYF